MDITNFLAIVALIASFISVYLQVKTQFEDLRPYLSFTGTKEIIRIDRSTKIAGIDFFLCLKNVGKSVLRYDVNTFDIFINGVKLSEVELKNKGSVIGVGTETTFSKYYNGIVQYIDDIEPEQYEPINHKIIFDIDYYKISNPRKKYRLKYEVFVEFEQGIKRELYGETFAN